ncbi:hypothetical protein NV63_13615 [Elizabethkingia anophelis]|nr:hypothetical protein NV63_13615 [Elizabethkingia anophelis]
MNNKKKQIICLFYQKVNIQKMYIRRNDINFWIEDSSLKFDKLNKVLFPSINVDSKCIKK